MKRTANKKLVLSKETIAELTRFELIKVVAGWRSATAVGSECLTDNCSVNYCGTNSCN